MDSLESQNQNERPKIKVQFGFRADWRSINRFDKVQIFWEENKNLLNLPYGLLSKCQNHKLIRQIAQIFVAFSENLNFMKSFNHLLLISRNTTAPWIRQVGLPISTMTTVIMYKIWVAQLQDTKSVTALLGRIIEDFRQIHLQITIFKVILLSSFNVKILQMQS